MRARGYRAAGKKVFIQLGRNWHGFLGGDHGGQPPGSPGARGGRGLRGGGAAPIGTHLGGGGENAFLGGGCLFRGEPPEGCAKKLGAPRAHFVFTKMVRDPAGPPWGR